MEQILAVKENAETGFDSAQPTNQSTNRHLRCRVSGVEPVVEGDIPALEAEIDRLVYALYDLTAEEIAVVEGKK